MEARHGVGSQGKPVLSRRGFVNLVAQMVLLPREVPARYHLRLDLGDLTCFPGVLVSLGLALTHHTISSVYCMTYRWVKLETHLEALTEYLPYALNMLNFNLHYLLTEADFSRSDSKDRDRT